MAQYEIYIAPLIEATDTIRSIADSLGTVEGRLADILSDMPECLSVVRQQVAHDCGAVGELSVRAKELSQTLYEISEIYAQAERSIFNVGDKTKQAAAPVSVSPPVIYRARGVFLPGSLLMPDWLQLAVLKYEQSQASAIRTH